MGTHFFQANKLYGRDKHLLTIMNTYRKVAQSKSSPEMVVVSGYSGTGKTSLVLRMQKPITDMGGVFISGKFDRFRQMEPLSAITAAFTGFCKQIAKGNMEKLHQTRNAIKEKVGSLSGFLVNLIPNLSQIIQIPASTSLNVGGLEAQRILQYVFRLFVRAVATPSQPLVLFIDDLQWADPMSLDVIDSLVTDAEIKSFLFLGSHRGIDGRHPLARKLRSLEYRQVNSTKIVLGNLSEKDTNEMVSDLLRTAPINSFSLSNAVHRKTSGNVLFTLQFLRSICDEGLMRFSSEYNQWQWDTAMIMSKKIADNAVELIAHKILLLPEQTQNALKLISCLGCHCEKFILTSMSTGDGLANFGCIDLFASIELNVKEGLVDRMGSDYRFAHDHIQQVAYSFIAESERGKMHLWIGNQVWTNKLLSSEKALFIAVGQLNKGSILIDETHERVRIARLNLQAAEKSKSLAAFVPAAFYLHAGISLLGKNPWTNYYDLCLQLYGSCAEANFCIGNFDVMEGQLKEVFSNARCLDDELESFFIFVSALIAQNKMQEALEVGLLVSAQLGEPFLMHSNMRSIIMVEFAKTKKMIEGKLDDEFLTMKNMNDNHKIAAMRLMYILALSAFQSDSGVFPLICLRMMQTSLKYGLCDESAYSFAVLGVLCCNFGQINEALRFGQLSLRLLDISKVNKCLPGIYACLYTAIIPHFHHYRSSLQPLELGYNVGMRNGDVSYATVCIRQFCVHLFHCGEELATVERIMRKYDKIMMELKQEIYQKQNFPYWQAVLNLMGHSHDPEQLIGEVMNQQQLLEETIGCKRSRSTAIIYHIQSWLAYIFGNHESASRIMEKRQAIILTTNPPFLSCSLSFVEGLISFAMAHKTGETKWSVLGLKCIEEIEKYSTRAPSNCKHKLLVLQAESAFVAGEYQIAQEKYDEAIDSAGKNNFIQDQALAFERQGIFHINQGNTSMASLCFAQAHSAYLAWGAKRKADLIRVKFSF